jgi:hypothetical protein
VYGNPEEIRRLARRVRTEAELTSAEAERGGNADAIEWKSLAAQRYRTQLADALGQAKAAVGELDELSDALMRHAAAVQERLDEIAAAERWLRGQAHQAANEVRDLVAGVSHVVSESVDWLQRHTDLIQVDASRRADELGRDVQRLPGGDLGWLDAARTHGWSG